MNILSRYIYGNVNYYNMSFEIGYLGKYDRRLGEGGLDGKIHRNTIFSKMKKYFRVIFIFW